MSLQDFTTFLGSLSEKVIEADETIPELPVKDIVSLLVRLGKLVSELTHIDISHL